jgi:hypothetical protein
LRLTPRIESFDPKSRSFPADGKSFPSREDIALSQRFHNRWQKSDSTFWLLDLLPANSLDEQQFRMENAQLPVFHDLVPCLRAVVWPSEPHVEFRSISKSDYFFLMQHPNTLLFRRVRKG